MSDSPTRRLFMQASVAAAAAVGSRISWAAPAPAPKKILILGGTAFLGPAIVAVARARGHTLTLFNRGKTNVGRSDLAGIEQLHGDRDGHLEALANRRWDAVIDDSGYVPRLVHDSATLLAPSVQHYVFVSTISVYADGSQPIDERSPVAKLEKPTEDPGNGAYGPLKALCETAAEAALPGRVTVVRPGLIVGPEDPTDRFTYWPLRLARGGEVLAPGKPSDPVSYIDVRDLAQWMVSVVERKITGTYNATGPAGTLGVGALVDGCSKAAARSDARLTWVDVDFLDKQNVHGWVDLPVWLSPRGEETYLGRISRERAVAKGLVFRSVADTARDTLAWWQTLPEARAKPRAGLTAEREREVLAAWHARK